MIHAEQPGPLDLADAVRAELQRDGVDVSPGRALNLVAIAHGYADWAAMARHEEHGHDHGGERLVASLHSWHADRETAILAWVGFEPVPGKPGEHRLGSATVRVLPAPALQPVTLTLDVDNLDALHERLRATTPDGTRERRGMEPPHVGMIGPADSDDGRRQFVIHRGRDQFLAIRERTLLVPGLPNRSVAGRDADPELADIQASARFPAEAYHGVGGPALWLQADLFERRTGARMASGATFGPKPGPWSRPRYVTGGRRADDPYEVELGEFVWEGQATRDIALLVSHTAGIERSRLQLQTTRLGDQDLVQISHSGWTGSNRQYRAAFLDWQLRLDRWVTGLTCKAEG